MMECPCSDMVFEESTERIISGIEVWENTMMRLYDVMGAKVPDRYFFFTLCELIVLSDGDIEDIEDEDVKNYISMLNAFGVQLLR